MRGGKEREMKIGSSIGREKCAEMARLLLWERRRMCRRMAVKGERMRGVLKCGL